MASLFSAEAFSRYTAALAQTELLPRSALDAYQDGLIKRLASFAFANSPFYAERLKPLFQHGDEPDLRYWCEIPILKRRDLADAIDRINPVRIPEDVGPVTARRTSGTTAGLGLNFRTCDMAKLAAEGMMHRFFRWHGLDLQSALASIRYYSSGRRQYPDGITEPFWCYSHAAPHYTLDYRTAIADMVEWLIRRRPRYLLTFPSIAHDLAAQAGIENVGVESIVGISELVSADTAIDAQKALGCEIIRIYACAEMGCIAMQSEAEPEYEICEETVLVEILDEKDNPVAPGENGRVVLTSFYNYATPFIRYEIGDYATLSDTSNASNRTLQKLKRVTGRKQNALIHRNGDRIWDLDVITPRLWQQFPSYRFSIQQPNLGTLEISFVPDPMNKVMPDQQVVADYFGALLGGTITIELKSVDNLTRSNGGKR
jgi:phenylacetate-CoA ligase